jgi:hypothetical protein
MAGRLDGKVAVSGQAIAVDGALTAGREWPAEGQSAVRQALMKAFEELQAED